MRIEHGNNVYKAAQKQEESQHPSKEEFVKRVQESFDQFDNNPRNISYDDIVSHFTTPPTPPEVVGAANAADIPEEALDKLRQQVAVSADQNKSEKKD